ncbi:MAG: hypothetical protein NTX11_04645 [Candidatus Saccharibacteria bacterium]|nr:hypothetical protein [Candidatus Saccharibacteria bacterium]
MAVLERSQQQKQLITRTTIGMIVGLVIFIGLLMSKASLLSNATGTVTGSIGPVPLFELSKNAVGNGNYQVNINLSLLRILALILFCASIGLLTAKLQQNINHKRDRIEL